MWFNSIPYDSEAPLINYKQGVLKLTGRCHPTDPDYSLGFLFQEIYNYLEAGNPLVLLFKFDYVNTGSSKKFNELLVRINQFRERDHKINSQRQLVLIWAYPEDDEKIEELGKYYKLNSNHLAKLGKYDKINFKLKRY